jgi:hypothetical protein
MDTKEAIDKVEVSRSKATGVEGGPDNTSLKNLPG